MISNLISCGRGKLVWEEERETRLDVDIFFIVIGSSFATVQSFYNSDEGQ